MGILQLQRHPGLKKVTSRREIKRGKSTAVRQWLPPYDFHCPMADGRCPGVPVLFGLPFNSMTDNKALPPGCSEIAPNMCKQSLKGWHFHCRAHTTHSQPPTEHLPRPPPTAYRRPPTAPPSSYKTISPGEFPCSVIRMWKSASVVDCVNFLSIVCLSFFFPQLSLCFCLFVCCFVVYSYGCCCCLSSRYCFCCLRVLLLLSAPGECQQLR